MLDDLYPCNLGQTCTSSSANNVDGVSLFVFPAVTTKTEADDWTCPGSGKSMVDPTIAAYTFSDVPTNLVQPSANTYELQFPSPGTWTNDYKTNDSNSTLNPSSEVVIAAGGSGVSGCTGVQAPGGFGTYYAQVIYAAQAALIAQQAANPSSSNAMIILSDGDATACASNANTSKGACNSKADLVATEGTLNGTGTSTSVTYPSALGECGQAVVAAQAAASAGTKVYTIGYGAETSGGCTTDAKYSASVSNGDGLSWAAGDQPCAALGAMASSAANFYSDDGSGCQATLPSNQSITQLTAIFRAIANNMSSPRLIPNGTT
jgi:hypothetical protein